MLNDIFDAVGSLVTGSERYLSASRVGLQLEQVYRQYRNQSRHLDTAGRQQLLAEAHQRGARKLTRLFHDNGAIWVKFGQFLSSRSDILPSQYVLALESLQDNAKPVAFRHIDKVLQREWGADWRRHFRQFDEQPVAAASVAQVHRAQLASGEEVAVKVQLPHARRLFQQDSMVFRALGVFGAPLISQFDLKQVLEQIITMTMQELDFLGEEANLRRFASLPHPDLIYVPGMYEALSTRHVLVTEWINGQRLSDYLALHPEQAQPLLRQMLSCYVQQITQFGVYHADPHPGNFLVMADGRVAVLDYGAIGELSPQEAASYGVLIHVLFGRMQSDLPLGQLFQQAGFVARDQAVFEEVAELVLKESQRNYDSTDILKHTLDKMRDLKVTIPDSFVTVARVVLTFGGLLKTYRVAVD